MSSLPGVASILVYGKQNSPCVAWAVLMIVIVKIALFFPFNSYHFHPL